MHQKHFGLQYLCDSGIVAGIQRSTNPVSRLDDVETNQAVYNELRKTYDGPLSLATDLLVWNITPYEVVGRRVVFNEDTWPTEAEGAKPPQELTWEPHHPMSDWLAQTRVTWDDVDQFD